MTNEQLLSDYSKFIERVGYNFAIEVRFAARYYFEKYLEGRSITLQPVNEELLAAAKEALEILERVEFNPETQKYDLWSCCGVLYGSPHYSDCYTGRLRVAVEKAEKGALASVDACLSTQRNEFCDELQMIIDELQETINVLYSGNAEQIEARKQTIRQLAEAHRNRKP